MPPTPNDYSKMVALVLNDKKPVEQRAQMLMGAFHSGDPVTMQAFAKDLLGKMVNAKPAAELEEAKKTYEQAIEELRNGGVRPATFIGVANVDMPGPKPRAHVVTPDGQERFPFFYEDVSSEDMDAGQTVYLDPQGAMILGKSSLVQKVGPEAKFVRRLPDTDQVEVGIREETITLYASRELLETHEEGELTRGDQVLICPARQFAFRKIPTNQDRRHRFVDSSKLPNILPGRDIGRPHPCLGWLVRRTRILMFRDDLRKKYDQRPRVSLLMTGPSGTGKTLTIKSYLTLFGKMLAERTGRDDLESRVIRVKMSEQLSEWLGRSDKNFEALFDDIQYLASQKVQTASGEWIHLPIVGILEEVDGIARRRSNGEQDGSGGAMDRIMSTLLQRLDDPMDEMSKLPLVLISTTNRPAMVDVAMHRRLGAKVARFTRLGRDGLAAVLSKKIKTSYPFEKSNGTSTEVLRTQLIDQVVGNFFSPVNDEPQLELTLRDGVKLKKYARDFLTGALIEQSISDTIDQLIFYAEQSGREDVGLDAATVISALRRQIETLAENVSAFNAADYVDIPEHTQVANVRRFQSANGHLNELVVNEA